MAPEAAILDGSEPRKGVGVTTLPAPHRNIFDVIYLQANQAQLKACCTYLSSTDYESNSLKDTR